jgi:hypothetical protein
MLTWKKSAQCTFTPGAPLPLEGHKTIRPTDRRVVSVLNFQNVERDARSNPPKEMGGEETVKHVTVCVPSSQGLQRHLTPQLGGLTVAFGAGRPFFALNA